jgi:phospholipid/cholesterol/gamma-HCH transport system permease protein
MLFAPIASVVGLLAQGWGNAFNALVVLNALDPATYWNVYWATQNVSDQLLCTVCLITQAVVMTLIGCAYGYRATGGPEGVGRVVARSITINLVAAFFITAACISVFYGLDPQLFFGG